MTADAADAAGNEGGGESRIFAAALSLVVVAGGLRLAPPWLSDPDLGHGWIVVAFLGWWLVERWRERPAAAKGPRLLAGWGSVGLPLMGLLALVPVRLLLAPYPYWPGLLWMWGAGVVAIALGAIACAGGGRWVRHFGFGVALVAVAMPWPQMVQRAIFEPLRMGISVAAGEVLNLSGFPTVVRGTTLQVAGHWVGMEDACAGLRSLQLALALAVMIGEAGRLRAGRRLALVGLGAVTAVVGNFARVLFLSWRAGRGVAADSWHDASGYFTYGLLLAVLGLVGWRWRNRSKGGTREPARERIAPLARRWALTAVVGVLALEVGTAWWFAAPDSGWQPSWRVQLPTGAPYFTALPLAAAGRELLRPDHYEGASWSGRDRLTRVAFYLEWKGGQAASQVPFAHNPTVCFPYAGCRLEQELGVVQVQVGERKIPFRGFRFTRAGQAIVAYFAIWDVDRQEELVDARPGRGLVAWWRSRWRSVAERRSQIRAQMLTVATLGEDGPLMRKDEGFYREQIEALLAPATPHS